ncbi:hypothetical protein COLO4_17923 [Corchorus olitorius]|uniref:Uncharacterized protein n=1 Tax=Corchorus olitorius TaxID=93759 RepID=A0A1R3JB47_9ROSI|nr:hypothetical protein COLO4_17923 [Corchorus olitorius]
MGRNFYIQVDNDHLIIQTNRADEEPSDPKKYLEDGCKPKCIKPFLSYQACVKRIQGCTTIILKTEITGDNIL